jgi:hypothetical protein
MVGAVRFYIKVSHEVTEPKDADLPAKPESAKNNGKRRRERPGRSQHIPLEQGAPSTRTLFGMPHSV